MTRGSQEFYLIRDMFEKFVRDKAYYLPQELTPDNAHPTVFYANGVVNNAFRVYMAGYAAAKLEFLQLRGG